MTLSIFFTFILSPVSLQMYDILRPDTGLKFFFIYYYIKRLVVTSLEDITKKISFFMVAILKNKKVSTDREYSPFYNTFFLVMAVDRPSILFVSCTYICFILYSMVQHGQYTMYND